MADDTFGTMAGRGAPPRPVQHWYDLTCPFCYVAAGRDGPLRRAGRVVVDLPFRAHPEIPPAGRHMGPRSGPMYAMPEEEARRAGLPLHWPDRLPSFRLALGAAEWTRVNQPPAAAALRTLLFAAHFARGLDIGREEVVLACAAEAGVTVPPLHGAVRAGTADRLLLLAEAEARRAGVRGTPAWLIDDDLITGLQPADLFERLARG